jgi:hypothetical protein
MRNVLIIVLSILVLSSCSRISPEQISDYYRAEKNFSYNAKIDCIGPDTYASYILDFVLNDNTGHVIFQNPLELSGYKIVYNNGFVYPNQTLVLTPYEITPQDVIIKSINALRTLEPFSYSYSGNETTLKITDSETEYQITLSTKTYDITKIKIFKSNELIYRVVMNV